MENETSTANKIDITALRKANGNLKAFFHMDKVEVMLAEDQTEAAVIYLRHHIAEDENMGAPLIDALLSVRHMRCGPPLLTP